MLGLFQLPKNQHNAIQHLKSSLKLAVEPFKVGRNLFGSTMRVADVVEMLLEERMKSYGNNRGTGELNMAKVKRIATEYDSNALGTFTFSDLGDGTFKQADAHHRAAALLMKYDGENGIERFTVEQLNESVSVHITSERDFLNVYSKLNSANGHSTRNKILNQDFAVGGLIEEILSLQGVDSFVEKKFYVTLTRCAYAYVGKLGYPIKALSYADISLDRKLVSSDSNRIAGEIDLGVTDKQKLEIAEALDYVNKTYSAFETINDIASSKSKKIKLSSTAKAIIANAGLFGFIFWDKLSGRELITDLTPKNLALRITEKDAQIATQAGFVLNSEMRDSAAEKIVAYIKTKKRK